VVGLHVSVVHGLLSLQTVGAPPHCPPEQTSGPVQALLSLHWAVLGAYKHPFSGSQLSFVQMLLSLQT